MKVYLAGYNVDVNVLKEMEKTSGKRIDLTPEVLSAAYARISRDSRSINEIRQSSREEVEKSRRSNSTIIFKMGHHSVAEHAIFNFDILGISRLAMEEVEKFRLCSYTEKSQRYITLQDDYIIPEEIKGAISGSPQGSRGATSGSPQGSRGTKYEEMFVDMVGQQNKAYFKLFEKLKAHVFEKHAELAKDPKKHNMIEGWAKEDARYITSLATESQVGLTLNARNCELMLRRFASCPNLEVQNLGRALYDQIADVAPSIVIFHEANDLDSNTFGQLKKMANDLTEGGDSAKGLDEEVKLVEYTKDADILIAASLLHVASSKSYNLCKEIVKALSQDNLKNIFKTAWQNMQFYDSVIREFEYANLTYNVALSSACFGQLKRHRMATITSQSYDPSLGITIPENIKEIGMDGYFQDIVDKTNEVYEAICKENPTAAQYILTNAHRKRVLIRVNARELYHISRLREDAHAQWDIQNISREMAAQAKKVMPQTFELIGGKDKYNENYEKVFGQLPKVKEAVLPEAKKIK